LALTDKEVRALPQRSQRYRVSDGVGLLLEVDPAGGKYWLWRHRFPPTKDGRRQDLRIGPYPRISLKAARDIRDEQKRLLYEDGINPCDAKKRSKDHRWGKHAQLTFEAVSLDWHATKTAGTWTERHSDDVLKKLNKDILPAIGGKAIDAITAQDCLAVPPRIGKWGSNETAKRSLGVISQVLDGAVAIGHCTLNPAHSLKRHAPVKQTTSHYPCIPWSELPELLAAMRANTIGADDPTLHAMGLPNSRRLRPGQLDALKQSLLGVLRQELFAAGSAGEQLWENGLVSRLLADASIGARTAGLLALIETPEALEGYLLRAQGQDDAKRRAQRCITAVQEASRLASGRGWLS
jgi:hypothetical protein